MAEIKEFKRPEIVDVNSDELKNVHTVYTDTNTEEIVVPKIELDSTDNMSGTDSNEKLLNSIGEQIEKELTNDQNIFNQVDNDYGTKNIEPKEDVAADMFIKTITPYKITFNKKDNRDIAIVVYLCRDYTDKLFIIDRNIIVKNDEHRSDLECIPFAEDKDYDFVNEKICTNLLLGHLDNYICDMKFSIEKDNLKDVDPVLRTTLTNVKTRETKVASINADTFAALVFIDKYIEEDIVNEHDLALAVMAGSKDCSSRPAEFFVVDSIDKIVAMAPAVVDMKKKKNIFVQLKDKITGVNNNYHPTSIGMVVKVVRYNGQEREVLQLLTPFDIGVEFAEEKFKGNSIASIEENYYGDSDQYVTTLTINSVEISGVDKTYMVIRAKAKTGSTKLFLLDSSIQKELQDKINEY